MALKVFPLLTESLLPDIPCLQVFAMDSSICRGEQRAILQLILDIFVRLKYAYA